MATLTDRLEENVPGMFYVDTTCIDCDQCREHAPGFFARDDNLGSSVVRKQPEMAEDVELCREAMAGCPTESIGCDGSLASALLNAHPRRVEQSGPPDSREQAARTAGGNAP